ncbi:hypothetical protein LY39_02170 [Roseinatronobacter bogoriensis subsp. barguzinensis]|nr:hypothetical protein [Rhodobaca bogoriensis DSM 18756]TDW39139.1 hypothetical protein LY39_02170 [Rhodobaca barguzinensis]TDY66459.1 hypothetical protein EV660_11169 [Rhodobaca bogoriensis DSM 18756]
MREIMGRGKVQAFRGQGQGISGLQKAEATIFVWVIDTGRAFDHEVKAYRKRVEHSLYSRQSVPV